MSQIWRRVVMLKWKPDACPYAVERAFTMHRQFTRHIPAVLHVSESRTFTGGKDGGGAYPGEHDVNRGFNSTIELTMACNSPAEVQQNYLSHPFHLAAAEHIDPLIEDAWPMDYLDDSPLVVPKATESHVKHVVFFKWTDDATRAQRDDLLSAWKATIPNLPGVLAMHCGEAVRWERGEKRGYDCGIVTDLALISPDGIQELHDYHSNADFLKIAKGLLKPIRAGFAVTDGAVYAGGLVE